METRASRPLLHAEVVEQIKLKIESGEWKYGDKIPSEAELAELFRVSRATLREAIAYLVNKAVLQRRRGIGTFVGKKEEIVGGLETLISTTKWIEQHGYQAGTQDIELLRRVPSRAEQELFVSFNLSSIGEIHRVRTADAEPVMFCVDIIPDRFMPEHAHEVGESLMAYLETRYGQVITLAHSTIEVARATREIAQKLKIPQGTALLRFQQIHYNQTMVPVLLSQDHFVPDRFRFDMIRRRS